MQIVEAVVFAGLLAVGFTLWILCGIKLKQHPIIADYERLKCESSIESRLYNALIRNGYYVRTQVPCGKYQIDLALPGPGYKLAIECNGKAYHSSPEQKARDRRKDRYLKRNGWKVLRFSGSMINGNMEKVLKRIKDETTAAHTK